MSDRVKGFIVLDKNMCDIYDICERSIKYELQKTYHISEEHLTFENGFHFCEKIEHIVDYCRFENNRIFEVETASEIVRYRNKLAATEIKLTREVSTIELNEYFKEHQEEFAQSSDYILRKETARQGFQLETLVYDNHTSVRRAVAD